MNKPRLIKFDQIGFSETGFISVAEKESSQVPFEIKRVYWTYYTPNHVERGNHAHLSLQQVIIAVSGTITFYIESLSGEYFEYHLDTPSVALYIPPGYWRRIKFSHSAVLLCLASELYNEDDYVRNYEEFKKLEV